MFASKDYYPAFRGAAKNGRLDDVKFLWNNCSEQMRQEMLAAENYYAFRWAALKGSFEVVKFLWKICQPCNRQEMLAAENYFAFYWTTYNEHFHIVKFLCENCEPVECQVMLTIDDCLLIVIASCKENLHVLDFLLSVANQNTRTKIYSTLQNPKFAQQLVLQREEIKNKAPEFDIDKFNTQLNFLCKNRTLSRMLLTCKNLPERLENSFQIMDIFAKTANFIASRHCFDSFITEPIKAAHDATINGSSTAIKSERFFIAARKLRFNLGDFEDKADSYIHGGEGCSIL